MSMVLPGVVGFKLSGKLPNGVTATDLVLTVTQILRKHGVVGKFVEFYGNFFFLLCTLSAITVCLATFWYTNWYKSPPDSAMSYYWNFHLISLSFFFFF